MFASRFCFAAGIGGMALSLVVPALAADPAGVRYDERNGYQLAFVEADVRRVVDAIFGSMLAADYSVDPDVSGLVTLRTAKPIAAESLIPLLEAALAPAGAVIVQEGSRYRVRTRASVRGISGVEGRDAAVSAPGYTSEVVTLRFASAREMERLLGQFLGKETVGGTDVARSQIIIVGTSDERRAARELIARFDTDTMADMAFETYRLENVDADALVAELSRIFQPPLDIIGTRVRLVPLPRLRSVLAIASSRTDLLRIEPWIRQLDTGGPGGKRKLYSYAVQNGRARDIATSLQRVMGASASDAGTPPSDTSSPPPTPMSDTSSLPETDTSFATVRSEPTRRSDTDMSLDSKGPRIVPNNENNSLLIYADGEEYEFIREALEKLDQPVAQVLIEATLAEVTLTNELRYGVDWSIASGRSTFDLSNNSSGVPSPIFPGFSYGYAGSNVQAVLNTLQSKTNVRVLSAPKLIVLNNQTASLQIGDQVPIITQQQQSTASPGAPLLNTVELRDTGVILKVTPRVNDSGTIILDINQEVSDVVPTTTSGINSPTIQQRRLASTVATRSGQMIALGGLIRDRFTNQRSGLPVFSQLPVIGGLFGRQNREGTRTELIVLLTPTVMRSPEEIKSTVDALIDGLDRSRALVEEAKGTHVGQKP